MRKSEKTHIDKFKIVEDEAKILQQTLSLQNRYLQLLPGSWDKMTSQMLQRTDLLHG